MSLIRVQLLFLSTESSSCETMLQLHNVFFGFLRVKQTTDLCNLLSYDPLVNYYFGIFCSPIHWFNVRNLYCLQFQGCLPYPSNYKNIIHFYCLFNFRMPRKHQKVKNPNLQIRSWVKFCVNTQYCQSSQLLENLFIWVRET